MNEIMKNTLLALFFSGASFANESLSEVPYQDIKINIDGALSEAAWKDALKIDLNYEVSPRINAQPDVKTTAKIISSNSGIYVSFESEYQNTDKIKVFLKERDLLDNDEKVGISIDAFETGKIAYKFFVNPLGVQEDSSFSEITGETKKDWDAEWLSSGQVLDNGYTTEIFIPYNSLSMPENEEQVWNINFERIYYDSIIKTFSNSPVKREISCDICQYSSYRVTVKKESDGYLKIIPSLVAKKSTLRDAGDNIIDETDDYEPSLDLKWRINSSHTLNTTINPDYSQVEYDDALLEANAKFALNRPEKRTFFLENNEYFLTSIDAVNTRSIVAPDYGLKFTGQHKSHTYGAFVGEDSETNLLIPGNTGDEEVRLVDENQENIKSTAAVARYRTDLNNNLSVGTILTSRSGGDYSNVVTGVDTNWYISDSLLLKSQYLHSETKNPFSVQSEFNKDRKEQGKAYKVILDYYTEDWESFIDYSYFSADFRADLGFVPMVDYKEVNSGLFRNWVLENQHISSFKAGIDGYVTHTTQGDFLEKNINYSAELSGSNNLEVTALYQDQSENFDGEVLHFEKQSINVDIAPLSNIFTSFEYIQGQAIDYVNGYLSDYDLKSLKLSWYPSKNIEITSTYINENLVYEGSNTLDAKVYDIRLNYQFNRESYLRLTWQNYRNIRDLALYLDKDHFQEKESNSGLQIVYAYKTSIDTVFYVGYSELHSYNPNLDKDVQLNKNLFVKFSYAFDEF
ncbi:hypothetical protein CWB98_17250 [Pseudoalteromonas rubra]|uniref:Uncharacterized protein n=1 Tax=Pseudoalteromonas rubra TaxID=43658 RepID=A0A5S3WW02_9GAMM|nr:hypothetical protein CWB98_17250 [Pseudoalteromonas rubra]